MKDQPASGTINRRKDWELGAVDNEDPRRRNRQGIAEVPTKGEKQIELRQGLQHPVSLRMGPLCLNHEHSVKDAGLPRCSASQEGHHPSIYFRP